MATFLGLNVITDQPAFSDLLESPVGVAGGERLMRLVEGLFPGMCAAALEGIRLFDGKRLRAATLVYFNFRVQLWAPVGYDADPTPPIRLIPVGVSTDPNGPTSFSSVVG